MRIEEKLCNKFPAVLREKLLSGEIELPDTAMFEYEKIRTYRAVKGKKKIFMKSPEMILSLITNVVKCLRTQGDAVT